MDIIAALDAFEALSQETRLAVFRELVKAGPRGRSAGEIATDLDVVQNTMSTHLQKLLRAGIVASRREGRKIIYSANFDVIRQLILFLMEDCCGRSAELCDPIAVSLAR